MTSRLLGNAHNPDQSLQCVHLNPVAERVLPHAKRDLALNYHCRPRQACSAPQPSPTPVGAALAASLAADDDARSGGPGRGAGALQLSALVHTPAGGAAR